MDDEGDRRITEMSEYCELFWLVRTNLNHSTVKVVFTSNTTCNLVYVCGIQDGIEVSSPVHYNGQAECVDTSDEDNDYTVYQLHKET